jgi:hypothetical protein
MVLTRPVKTMAEAQGQNCRSKDFAASRASSGESKTMINQIGTESSAAISFPLAPRPNCAEPPDDTPEATALTKEPETDWYRSGGASGIVGGTNAGSRAVVTPTPLAPVRPVPAQPSAFHNAGKIYLDPASRMRSLDSFSTRAFHLVPSTHSCPSLLLLSGLFRVIVTRV